MPKLCRICKDPEAEFYKHQSICIDCMSAQNDVRRVKEKEKIKQAKFTTDKACQKWNQEHPSKFEAPIKHKIATEEGL